MMIMMVKKMMMLVVVVDGNTMDGDGYIVDHRNCIA